MVQIVATEVRWRDNVPSAPGPGQWSYQTFPAASSTVTLRGLRRGVTYDVEARNLGANGRSSDWVVGLTAE